MKGKVINMKYSTVKTLGTVDMKRVSMDLSGQITIFFPLEEIGETADEIIDNCMSMYEKKYPGVDTENDIYWGFSVLYTCGLDDSEWSEYMAEVCIWQKSDNITGKDTGECYSDIHLSLSEEEQNKVKQIIVDKMADMLFGSAGSKKAVA